MNSESVPLNRLYSDLAWLWPLVSNREEYVEEADCWRLLLREHLGGGRRHHVLELGVGGGHNLSHLTGEFDATAVDLSEAMLAHSRQLNPRVEHILGDMRTVRLQRKFAAVLIHDAIDYMLSEDDLRATFATAAAHLEPGGYLLMSPDYFRDSFVSPQVYHMTSRNSDCELTYVEYVHDPYPDDTTVEMIMTCFIRRAGKLEIEFDRHVLGLFSRADWLRLLAEAGFQGHEQSFRLQAGSSAYTMLVGTLLPSR